MSRSRALREMKRFLKSTEPEVLSVTGRWGVGKTHAWNTALKGCWRSATPRKYAYVSAFGVKDLEALKVAIFQSTVSLGSGVIEPTAASIIENIQTVAGAKALGSFTFRKSFGLVPRILAYIPYADKLTDLAAPGATLFVRDQIICIDDIERAGKGIEVKDLMGTVSFFKEQRKCKVILLLNEDSLEEKAEYRTYLEKTVDRTVTFEPTPEESADAANLRKDELGKVLAEKAISLGITNIRVIARIRRFLGFVERQLDGQVPGVIDRVVTSIALLGWSVFEPGLAPNLETLQSYDLMASLVSRRMEGKVETDKPDSKIFAYGFKKFESIDAVLLDGIRAGSFDAERLSHEISGIAALFKNGAATAAIEAPWEIFRNSFDDNQDAFLAALIYSIENHSDAMAPSTMSSALGILKKLGQVARVPDLIRIYMEKNSTRKSDFFEGLGDILTQPLDEDLKAAFDAHLQTVPVNFDAGEILARIAKTSGWREEDVHFLASLPAERYVSLFKATRDVDLRVILRTALELERVTPLPTELAAIVRSVTEALRIIGSESDLNALRVAAYISQTPPPRRTPNTNATDE